MEELNVLIFATGKYRDLVEYVLKPSLPADMDEKYIKFIYDDKDIALPGATHDADFKEKMLQRIIYYRDYVKEHMSQKVLFLDCDVVFLQPFKEEMLKFLDDYDFAIQKKFSAGIWGVNCNERSLDFFNHFVEYISQIKPEERPPGYPQFELNATIEQWMSTERLKVLQLSEDYGFITENTKIYHAMNGGETVFSKFCILKLVEKYDFYGAPEKKEKTLGWMGCIREKDLHALIAKGESEIFFNELPSEYRVEEDIRKVIELKNSTFGIIPDELVYIECSWLNSPETPTAWSIFPLSELI
jgi:hypothetical protein